MSKIDQSLFSTSKGPLDGDFGECPDCHGKLQVKHSKNGTFLGCQNYPGCQFSKPLHDNQTIELKQMDDSQCPRCEAPLTIKKGRYGLFIGCSTYPLCDHIESINQKRNSKIDCPKCGKGELIERTSKFGKSFYACNNYPQCKYLVNGQPATKECPKCHWPIMVEKSVAANKAYVCPQKGCGGSTAD